MITGSVEAPEPRFERRKTLGTGASAHVELVRLLDEHGSLPEGTEVARKTLHPKLREDPAATRALFSEADIAAAVRDPSLVRVLHRGKGPDGPYLLLSFVEGRSLRELIETDGPLPEPAVRAIARELAGALATLAEAGYAHGDLKPENVRLDAAGRAVLLDLGFARRLEDASAGQPGAGSLAYLSPERAQGAPPGPEADVFALGVLVYELATGVHPFGYIPQAGARPRRIASSLGFGSSSGELLRRSIEIPGADELLAAISRAKVTSPSHFAPELSPFFDALLEEMLARPPQLRPGARELVERLEEAEASAWWRQHIDPETPREGPTQREGIYLTPMIGRERELALLQAALEQVRTLDPHGDRQSSVVWLSGPEGSGKWRLASEFAARARRSSAPPLYLYARWNEPAEALPAGLLLVLLARYLLLPTGTAPGEREEELLRELLPPALVRTLLRALDPERTAATEESVPAALGAWFVALGKRRPLILFLDDLHLAGEESLGAISHVLEGLDSTATLWILGVREDTPPAQAELLDRLRRAVDHALDTGGSVSGNRISLAPLGEADIQALVNETFESSAPRLRLGTVLWEKSRGNPGLFAETLREMLRRGHAAPDEFGQLKLFISPDEIPTPRSVDRLIAERFAALEGDDRTWLERLSVVGGKIAPAFLVRAFPPTTRAEIDTVLAGLVRRGWLVPRGDRYRFDRPALREAVYRSLAPSRRRHLHLAAAHGLELEAANQAASEDDFQHAFHLRAAGEHEELLANVLPQIQRLERRASSHRIATLARWGLEAQDALGTNRPEERAMLLRSACDAANRLGRRDEERRLLDRMIDLSAEVDRPADAALLYLLHGRYAIGTGQYGLARGMLRNASQLAHEAKSPMLESEARRRLSRVQAQIGELAEARRNAKRAIALAVTENQEALGLIALAHAKLLDDGIEDALHALERAGELMRQAAEPRIGILATLHLMRARVWRSSGRLLRSARSVRRAIRFAKRSGERSLEAEARARLGMLYVDFERFDEAEAHLRDALYLAEEIEDRRGKILARLWLGLLLWERDDPGAEASVRRATEEAREIAFYRAEAFGLALLARIHILEEGSERVPDAETESISAMELLDRHGAEVADRIMVAGTRALVLRLQDQERKAVEIERKLERHVARGNRRLKDVDLRKRQRDYTRRLTRAVLSQEGPVYPHQGN